MSYWYWSKAANLLAYGMARNGATVNEILTAIENNKWLSGKAALACALSNWQEASKVRQQSTELKNERTN